MIEVKIPPTVQILREKLASLEKPMRVATAEAKKAVEENFRTEGAHIGAPWKDLSAERKKQREKQGKWPGKILQVRGDLARSFTTSSTSSSGIVGTNLEYARIHHYGGTINISRTIVTRLRTDKSGKLKRQTGYPNLAVFAGKRHKLVQRSEAVASYTVSMPARPFMDINDEDVEEIREIFLNYLTAK